MGDAEIKNRGIIVSVRNISTQPRDIKSRALSVRKDVVYPVAQNILTWILDRVSNCKRYNMPHLSRRSLSMHSLSQRRARLPRAIGALVGAVVLIHGSALFSQLPKDLPPDVAAELARSPKPPLPNQVVGIDVDRFIGNPLLSPVRVTHGVIFMRTILTHGDPYHPGDPGAVLEYRKDLSLGTILGYYRTPLVQVPEEQFWYVESGKGRLESGGNYWDLHEGIGALIPPNAPHEVVNSTDEPLQMLMLTWTPEGVTPRADILVRDVNSLTLPAQGAHWNYFGTDFFAPPDGLHPNEQFA